MPGARRQENKRPRSDAAKARCRSTTYGSTGALWRGGRVAPVRPTGRALIFAAGAQPVENFVSDLKGDVRVISVAPLCLVVTGTTNTCTHGSEDSSAHEGEVLEVLFSS